jgi:hypothetical protein
MVVRSLLIASLLAGLLPLTGHAQMAPIPARFYVGLGVNMLSNVPFNDQEIVPRIIGPSATIGTQFTPRLAVQVGVSYHREKYATTYEFAPAPGSASSVTATSRTQYFIVPVLLRYSVTAPAERFHFEVLGGATWVHAASRLTYESDGLGIIDPALRASSNSDSRFNLTLGPAVRRTLSSHLELMATGLVSAVVGENYYRFRDRLFLNTSLGVNYTFGQR